MRGESENWFSYDQQSGDLNASASSACPPSKGRYGRHQATDNMHDIFHHAQ
jgi:hypothetical protein